MVLCYGGSWVMKGTLITYYYIFSLLLGIAIYFGQLYQVPLPRIVRFYINDFLIVPIILTTSLFILRWSRNDKNYQISIWIVLYLCALYSVIFEYFLPKFHLRYTADSIDVILYFASGLIFYILQKNKNE